MSPQHLIKNKININNNNSKQPVERTGEVVDW